MESISWEAELLSSLLRHGKKHTGSLVECLAGRVAHQLDQVDLGRLLVHGHEVVEAEPVVLSIVRQDRALNEGLADRDLTRARLRLRVVVLIEAHLVSKISGLLLL